MQSVRRVGALSAAAQSFHTATTGTTFGAIASSAAAAATSSTKDHLQHLTTTAGHVLHNLLKEKDVHAHGGHAATAAATAAGASAAAAAAAAAQQDATLTPAGRYTRSDLRRLCAVLATAEYCLDTVQQLEDKLREKIVPALRDRIDLGDERERFHRLIAQCIQLLVADVELGCDAALAAMVRIQWQQVSERGREGGRESERAYDAHFSGCFFVCLPVLLGFGRCESTLSTDVCRFVVVVVVGEATPAVPCDHDLISGVKLCQTGFVCVRSAMPGQKSGFFKLKI